MEKVTRSFDTVEELLEVIVLAYKRCKQIHVYLPKEIPVAANVSEGEIFMQTQKVKGDCENYLLLSLKLPEEEKMEFDVDSTPCTIYKLSVDFSKQTDYCGLY